jgi:muramoyltetrapeptide carboxypeptidase
LQLAIWAKCRVPSISGPMVAVEMATGILDFTEEHFWKQINNATTLYEIDLVKLNTKIWNPGICEGTLLGGCLSMVSHQLGTPYSPDYKGSILFIEDVGEEPYKIDRYLAHLKQAGIFNNINGLIIGQFLDCTDDGGKSFTVDDILHQYFHNVNFPVLYNFPYGHGMKKISMPLGCKTKMDTKKRLLTFENPFIA